MEWQPIETAPKDGTHVLGYFEDVGEGVAETWFKTYGRTTKGEWDAVTLPSHGCGCCSYENSAPTHWMPLPEAPKC